MELTLKQKTAFGIGAVGKDMVYALSASYVMYYYQDVLGLSASFVGVVLMAARFFRALDRKSTRLNSSHANESRMPSSA